MNLSSYEIVLNIPVELEDIARDKAYKMGLRKGGRGNLSGYVRALIFDDLNNQPPLNPNINNTIDDSNITRVKITFPRSMEVEARERAKELGFVRTVEGEMVGNMTRYIIYLLSQS